MSYQVLARRYRPRSFRELVGQGHVSKALVNALSHDRLHHALLFTGTRGVGKTTIARILAKSLNCEQGVGPEPCGSCGACREIDQGRFVDLIEVDAASRTGVDDTRELLDNVQYAPTRGRYKVYLIDEVHMFSKSSFNALLKTLEEPPPHVKFLLATTDPQRLPVTVLSRCLQFNLRRLPFELIAAHLTRVLEQENIEGQPYALELIARAGDGSMRDALSLLDQAIAFGGGQVRDDQVAAMLGAIDRRHILGLLDALADRDSARLLDQVAQLDGHAPDYEMVLADLISLLQRIALVQQVPGALDDSLVDPQLLQGLGERFTPEDVQLYYQIALLGRRDLPLSPEPRGGFEMVMLRMLCFSPDDQEQGPPAPSGSQPSAAGMVAPSGQESPARPEQAVAPKAEPAVTPATPAAVQDDWETVVNALGLTAIARQLALNCAYRGRQGDTLYLQLDPAHAQMRSRNAESRLQQALSEYHNCAIRVKIQVGEAPTATPARQQAQDRQARQSAAEAAIQQDPAVHALQENLDAQIRPDSI
ncbi:MAG: DNA polymerase III subunit gamma/tau, partial [Candidatus Competibacteraceae bacterium]|nr:DNA polymerase III subunit gamma/tau [Candidatus Competibacteraceae bacterium]